jgi:hypothetical protein
MKNQQRLPQQKQQNNKHRTKIIIGVGIGLILYVVLTLLPFTGPYFQYPVNIVRCMRLPVVASDYTHDYYLPGKPSYGVSLVYNHFYCTEAEAKAAGFDDSQTRF